MQENKEDKIREIIKNNYNEQEELLSLQQQKDTWIDVLLSRDWSHLKAIDLLKCEIDDHNISIFVDKDWPQLKTLCIGENVFTCVGLNLLLSKQFPNLQILSLQQNQNIKDEGFETILKNIKNLKDINLSVCGITWRGLKTTLNYQLTNLKQLKLSRNLIGSTGIKWLTKANLPNLSELNLANCQIGAQGYKHLVKGHWANLNWLSYGNLSCQDYNKKSERKQNVWSDINLHNWKNLTYLYIVCQKQSICSLYAVLISAGCFNLSNCPCQIQNTELFTPIKQVFENKCIYEQ